MRRLLTSVLAVLLTACRGGCDPRSSIEQALRGEASCPELVMVAVEWPGASAEEVDNGVVLAVEEAVASFSAVQSISSRATEGRGEVVVDVDDASGQALRSINDAVDGIRSFPVDAERPVVAEVGRSQMFVVAAPDASTLSGAVDMAGRPQSTIEFEVEASKLASFRLQLDDVAQALRESQLRLGRGSIEDLSSAVVRSAAGGEVVRVRDIATIRDTVAPLPRAYRGDQSVVLGFFRRTEEGKPPEVGGAIDAFGPLGCGLGRPALVSLVARLPAGTAPEEVDAVGRRIALEVTRVEPRGLIVLGDTLIGPGGRAAPERVELLAPAGEEPEDVAVRLAGVLADTPDVAVIGVVGVPSAVELDVVHDDREARRTAVEAMLAAARARRGVFVGAPPDDDAPQIVLDLLDRGRTLGLTHTDLTRQLQARTHGVEVMRIRDGSDDLLIRLRQSPQDEAIDETLVTTRSGESIPLGEVARIELRAAVAAVVRRDRQRVATVTVFGPGAKDALDAIIEAGQGAAPVSIRRRSGTTER